MKWDCGSGGSGFCILKKRWFMGKVDCGFTGREIEREKERERSERDRRERERESGEGCGVMCVMIERMSGWE